MTSSLEPLDRSDLRARMRTLILRLTGRSPETGNVTQLPGVDLVLLEEIVREFLRREVARSHGEPVKPQKTKPTFPVEIEFIDEQIREVLGRYYPQVMKKPRPLNGVQQESYDEALLRDRVRQEIYRLVYKDAYWREVKRPGLPVIDLSGEILNQRVREVFSQELRVLLGGSRLSRDEEGIMPPNMETLDLRMRGMLDWCLERPSLIQHSLTDEDIERILERGLGG